MREIKFRAWDKENEHMVYSDKYECYYNFSFDSKTGNLTCAVNYCHCDIFGDEHDDWNELDNIMQYTGITDKNDKGIYDGDICKCIDEDGLYQVKCDPDIAAFVFVQHDRTMFSFGDYSGRDFEVVGNIYENPELLQSINCD